MTHEVAPIIKLAELESPSVIMMSGVPGSGKSYLAEQLGSLLHIPVISSDAIREEISGDADNQEVSAEAWQLLYNRVEHSIRDQQTIIVDATHALREYRISDIKRYRLYGAQSVVAANVLTTRETALNRNASRTQHVVPVETIERMYASLASNPPRLLDGFDVVVNLQND